MSDDAISIGGREFVVRRVGTDAQNASAKVKGNEIVVRIPVHWPREEGFRAFLDLKRKIVRKLEARPKLFERKPIEFFDGQTLTLAGQSFTVAVIPGTSRTSSAWFSNGRVEVKLGVGLDEQKRMKHVSNLARRVISRQVLPWVNERVKSLNDQYFGFTFRKVFLKETSSRWGSCSENGNINLHFGLLFAPQEVMDSVIIHELAHLKEQNHGDAFWALVFKAMPDYKEKRKWLFENARRLGVSSMENPD